MKKYKRILSISAGLSLFAILLVSNLLGILTDKAEESVSFDMEGGNVAIALDVIAGENDGSPIRIQPNQVVPLSIVVSNTGSKECYVFVELVIPEVGGHKILNVKPTGNWSQIDVEGREVYQYTRDSSGIALPKEENVELVDVATFYDFTELVDFDGSMKVVAYAVQTDGFENMEASAVWSATVSATN